ATYSERREIRRAARFAAGPLENVGAMAFLVPKDHWSVAGEEMVRHPRNSGVALDANFFHVSIHELPIVVHLVFSDVVRMGFFDIDVRLIRGHDRDAPGNALVMSERNARQRRFTGADDVPAGRVQVYEIPQRR